MAKNKNEAEEPKKTPEEEAKEYENYMKSMEERFNVTSESNVKDDIIIHTGVFGLDYCLDGGIRERKGGHRIEFFGAESSGKTTMALKIIAKYQKLGKHCVYLDCENSYDKEWATALGVDDSKLYKAKPETLEDLGDLLCLLIPKNDLIIWDSVPALIPETEAEGDTADQTIGLQARVNAHITRKVNKELTKRPTTLIFLNQLRDKIGCSPHANPETTPGGRALRHFYNTRIQFRPGAPIEITPDGAVVDKKDARSTPKKERIGMEINIINVKNKVGVPYRKSVVDFYFTGDIDNKKSLFFAGLKYCIITKTGNTYTYGEEKAVGQDKFMEKVMNDKICASLEEELWKRIK